MAYLGLSSDFDLDDDGILRDNSFQLDEDGILRDDFDVFTKAGGLWTDSGFSGDKHSSQSTLRHINTSFDDDDADLHLVDDRSINISEFEASKDDLDFDQYSTGSGRHDLRQSYDGPHRLRQSTDWFQKSPTDHQDDLFTDSYYQELRDLGVLVDGSDFENNQHFLLDETDQGQSLHHEDLYVKEGPARAASPREQVQDESHVTNKPHEQPVNRHLLPRTRSNSTVSSRSFPEITPEEAEELYTNRSYKYVDKKSAFDFYNSTGTSKDYDDEIFFITSRIPSTSLNNLKESQSVTPNQSNTSTRATSPTSPTSSRTHSPYSKEIWKHQSKSQEDLKSKGKSTEELHIEVPERANTATPTEPKSQRTLSAASQNSTASENLTSHSKKLPKAVSQESFFDSPKTPRSEKMPKRILPKPNAIDEEEYKIKCKSTTNISGKSGPVKPTHMTISEITRITMDETDDPDGKGKGEHVELSTKLKQEFNKRKQATELVQQLQKDYDSLLSKYALAELTIDQMRLGAKINVYADSPTPNQIQMSSLSAPQSLQMINLGGGTPGRGLLSASPSTSNRYLSPNMDGSDIYGSSSITSGILDSRSTSRTDKLGGTETPATLPDQDRAVQSGAQQVKNDLLSKTKNLDQRIQSFENLVCSNALPVEDKEEVFNKIRTDHEELRRQYLQSKEDYNVLRRSGATATDANFDEDKELEGELFKLGMKFDEIHAEVDSHFKENKEHRQPFQSKRLTDDINGDDDMQENAIDQFKARIHDATAGNDIVPSRPNTELESKLHRLNDEYNALMARYGRLKQMAQTPDRDKEIDNLVRKLKVICDEAPDQFRLPPELQQRMERLAKKDENNKMERDQLNGLNGEDVGRIESSNLNFESNHHVKGNHRNSAEYLNGRRGQSPLPGKMNGRYSPSGRLLTGERNGRHSPNTGGRHSPNTGGRHSPGTHGASGSGGRQSPSGQYQGGSKSITSPGRYYGTGAGRQSPGGRLPPSGVSRDQLDSDRDSNSSYSPRDGGSGRVQRPRRHDHDYQGRKLRKNREGGSTHSLPDSGISDQGEGASALAKLPGPGKFKQMTRQHADDVDSGFVGSLVGPGTEHPQPHPEDQQETFRLRLPAGNQERPDSRQSLRRYSDSQNQTSQTPHNLSLNQAGNRPSSAQRREQQQTQTSPGQQSRHRPPSVHSSRRSSLDRYDEAGQTLDLTYEEESELSDSSTRPQRGGKIKSKNQATGSRHGSVVETEEEEDSDVTPRAEPQIRSRLHQNQPTTKSKTGYQSNNRSQSKPVRGRHSFSSGEITPTATSPRDRTHHGTQSFDLADEQFERHSAQKLKSRNMATSSPPKNLSAKQSQRENARALRNLTTLGPSSDHEINDASSDITRASSERSTRLRALQDQIDRLRENMGLQPNQQIPPPPAPHPNQGPDYYDPFDDPYGFMRMPRRRANSFSGRGEREFDEWYWSLPGQRQTDDIPLGYAAADAYADRPPVQSQTTTSNPVRARIQQRRREKERRHSDDGVPLTRSGYSSDPNLHIPASNSPEFNPRVHERPSLHHQIPPPSRYSTSSMRQQMTTKGYFTTPSGAKIYASQLPQYSGRSHPNRHELAPSGHSVPFTSAGYSSYHRPSVVTNGYVSDTGYRPRVHSLPQSQQPFVRIRRPYSQRTQDISNEHYFSDGGVINGRRRSSGYSEPVFVVPAPCSMCGGTGEHTHTDIDEESLIADKYRRSSSRSPSRRRSSINRKRSRSVPRLRPYERRRRSSYSRNYTDLSSGESDDSELFTPRRRSRSLSRGRRYRLTRTYSDNEFSGSEDSADLNDSLTLSEDIKKLTRKMTKEVHGELRKYRRKRDLGYSDW